MTKEEVVSRLEKERVKAARNLQSAKNRSAPVCDIRNLELKIEYYDFLLNAVNS